MGGWVDGWTDGRMDGRMYVNGWKELYTTQHALRASVCMYV